jgi:hypothetical protein
MSCLGFASKVAMTLSIELFLGQLEKRTTVGFVNEWNFRYKCHFRRTNIRIEVALLYQHIQ